MRLKIITAVTGKKPENKKMAMDYLNRLVSGTTEIEFESVRYGFPSIESEVSAVFNTPDIISCALRAQKDGCDGIFINCFDDPGVQALREILDIPVLGGYVPAISTALALGERIGIVTTDRNGILSEERKAMSHGFDRHIKAIEEVEMGVLELDNKDLLAEKLLGKCRRFSSEHRIQALCLGCTGMFHSVEILRHKLKQEKCRIQVVEPMAAGIKTLEKMVSLGLSNSLYYNLSMGKLSWYEELR